MKRCENCNINILSKRSKCPLCQNILTTAQGKESVDVFPYIPTVYHEFRLFFKVLIFISIVVSIFSVLVNLALPETGFWSLLVVFAVICFWASLASILRKRKNIQKTILYQVFIYSTIAIVWDLIIGWQGWSLEYVIPNICIVAMVLLTILYKVLDMPIRTYFLYFIINGLFGIVPIILYFSGAIKVYVPSFICVAVSVVCVSALFVFMGDSLIAEFKKRFHL